MHREHENHILAMHMVPIIDSCSGNEARVTFTFTRHLRGQDLMHGKQLASIVTFSLDQYCIHDLKFHPILNCNRGLTIMLYVSNMCIRLTPYSVN